MIIGRIFCFYLSDEEDLFERFTERLAYRNDYEHYSEDRTHDRRIRRPHDAYLIFKRDAVEYFDEDKEQRKCCKTATENIEISSLYVFAKCDDRAKKNAAVTNYRKCKCQEPMLAERAVDVEQEQSRCGEIYRREYHGVRLFEPTRKYDDDICQKYAADGICRPCYTHVQLKIAKEGYQYRLKEKKCYHEEQTHRIYVFGTACNLRIGRRSLLSFYIRMIYRSLAERAALFAVSKLYSAVYTVHLNLNSSLFDISLIALHRERSTERAKYLEKFKLKLGFLDASCNAYL